MKVLNIAFSKDNEINFLFVTAYEWSVMLMAVFKFYQIYRSIQEELGEDMAVKLFPEYLALPEKMLKNLDQLILKMLY